MDEEEEHYEQGMMNLDDHEGTSDPIEAKAFCIGEMQTSLQEGGQCLLDSVANIVGWLNPL